MKSTGRIKVLGLLALPLLALVAAVMVVSWGFDSSSKAEAADPGVGFHLEVDGVCSTAAGDAKCAVSPGANALPISIYLDDISGIGGAWSAWAATLNFDEVADGITSKGQLQDASPAGTCSFVAQAPSAPGFENTGCVRLVGTSGYTGKILTGSLNWTCSKNDQTTISLKHGASDTQVTDGGTAHVDKGSDVITLNCLNPTDTPTPPPPTDTPTPLPTATPPPQPRVQKLPELQNVFLERQGSKIPPVSCMTGADTGSLAETLQYPIPLAQIGPKGTPQQLGAFEFEVHFDATKVCVEIDPGAAWAGANVVCFIEDATNSQLEGVARIGCVTVGKDVPVDPLTTVLANITVRPQPDVYSQAKPNQDNGVVVQLNNVGCEVADDQGHPLPIFSCEDADITYRYLEGDVSPDCSVNALDTQSIAFRWGANKGSLIFLDRFNLEPSGTQADQDIDVNDLQFVYGRFGSNCASPWPAQAPVNPKA